MNGMARRIRSDAAERCRRGSRASLRRIHCFLAERRRLLSAPSLLVAAAGFLTAPLFGGSAAAQVNVPRDPHPSSLPLHEIVLPPGFEITLVSDAVPRAREIAEGSRGTIFVGTRGDDKVYALRDRDGDGRAEDVRVILSGLNDPNGVAVRGEDLYVAEIHRVTKYERIEDWLDAKAAGEDAGANGGAGGAGAASRAPDAKGGATNREKPRGLFGWGRKPKQVAALRAQVVRGDLPRETWHGQKFIAFGPDGRLYVPVGAPCNVCEKSDPRYASLLAMNPDGSGLEVYARGIRNTVGFDWHPETGELWFTDNGRDELGDDLPSDELNRATKPGEHFGFPYCHAGDVKDPEFGRERGCGEFTPPAWKLGAHVAALGMSCYGGTAFPQEYQGDIYIAEHGSWNRTAPSGYRVVRVVVENGRAVREEPFASGWLRAGGNEAWGRPVHVFETRAGDLLVSDDRAGAVYRIRARGESTPPNPAEEK